MCKKVLCFLNGKIKDEINLKKVGIKIRNIDKEEIKIIKNKIEEIYCSKEQMELFQEYQKARSVKKDEQNIEILNSTIATYEKLVNLEDSKRNAIYYLEKHNGIFDKKIINRNLKKCIMVEINQEQYDKSFKNWSVNNVIFRIMNFANYIGGKFNLINFYIIEIEQVNNYENIVNDINYAYCDIEILEKISKILENKDINFNSNFIFMIDDFLVNTDSFENRIIKMVSSIERLLIKDVSNKQQAFVLKVGMLIKKDINMDNDSLSKLLKTIYDVRSLLVHGNEDSIYRNKDHYSQIFNNEELKNAMSKIEYRYKLLSIVTSYLENIAKAIWKRYIDDVELIEYIKNN